MQIPKYVIQPKYHQIKNKEEQKDNIENDLNPNFDSVQDTIKQFYSTQSEIPLLFENMEGMKSYDIKNYYINLKTFIQHEQDESEDFDQVKGEKIDIEVDQIFDEIMKFKSASKILILGGAGVGKSTLMQFMAYKWSVGEIWLDKFDNVYRVMLKTLLNSSWKFKYQQDKFQSTYLNKNPLKYLIHYNILMNSKESNGASKIKTEDINLDNKSSNLLLLDGYDEVHHLFDDPTCKTILSDIFQYKNIVLTSRPNAVSKVFKQNFERIIENTGLDKQGIQQIKLVFTNVIINQNQVKVIYVFYSQKQKINLIEQFNSINKVYSNLYLYIAYIHVKQKQLKIGYQLRYNILLILSNFINNY